jgi:hypothetical protein
VKDYRFVMKEEDVIELRAAMATLEHPGLASRLGEIAGKPIELLGRALPETASKAVAAATTKALNAALAGGAPDHAKRAQSSVRPAAQGAGGDNGGGGRQFWGGCTADRASDLDHHHAAVDWGRRPQRG